MLQNFLNKERQRFSIRKYTIGVASVLVGLTFLTSPRLVLTN